MHAPSRSLALLAVLAMLGAGCISASSPLSSSSLPGAVPVGQVLQVVKDGARVQVPAEQVLGAVPHVVEKLLGTRGGEPNIGVTGKGSIFITSGDYVMKSTDRGDHWSVAYEFGSVHDNTTPATRDPIRNSDPMLWVDPVTDRVFAPFMFPVLACAEGVWSDDDGASWTDRPMDCGLPGIDHQKLATGPYAKANGLVQLPTPGSDYPSVVYFCYNDVKAQEEMQGSATRCAMSTDGGNTFPTDNLVASDAQCGGINGHPTAAPNGTVFVPLGLNCGQPTVARSFDNGATWQVLTLHVGGLGSEDLDNEVAVTADGTSYYMWRAAADHQVYVVHSKDAFTTTSRPVRVSPPDVTSTRFLAMTNGDDGRLAFAYLGTRDAASRPSDAYDDARWHMFVTMTFDAASASPTFVTTQVTNDTDPVQIGYMWEGGGGDPARNLLDFIDIVADKDGRIYVSFTDGCTKDCAGNAQATKEQSRSRDTALAVLESGPLLRAHPVDFKAKPAGALPALPRTG